MKKKEPLWIDERDVLAVHDRLLALHGGATGLRDLGLPQPALARPRQHDAYARTAEVIAMAALYTAGIVRNHPFVDGNKRAAFASLMVFLRYNGVVFAPSPTEATAIMLDLAAGSVDEAELARWIRANWPRD